MQDEDIGFNWNHLSQTDKPKQKDSVLKDKSQVYNIMSYIHIIFITCWFA